ncbi:RNA polymerase-associated protein RapA [Pedobacter sp. Bi27]|uniref:DEAD/DEAH box helicase n=1 Tax=unclassified Pedobacter TaxID=2628915 RepID=UPI001D918F91|nr:MULTISPECIES: DEAD/DEAH box helicase [unclassified Pedobacter]CAH0159863.1 RNA polymerase-associated protein RapA [Pedobacter sp. Bi126]CAH0160413.1 RNA polymerase-associated protein RapA [Pedobacter sp. Bi27]CAH0279358.1 RNA polymerase-associated protein RapA [Pedobacter sp. Bi36]
MSEQVTAHLVSEQNPYDYILTDFNLKNLSQIVILKHLSGLIHTDVKGFYQLFPEQIEIDFAAFSDEASGLPFPIVQVQQHSNSVKLSCRCATPKHKLCEHQARVLYNILQRQDLLIFFDANLRKQKLLKIAIDYGLEKEENLDLLFNVKYENGQLDIRPKMDALQPFNKEAQQNLQELLLPANKSKIKVQAKKDQGKMILVFGQHRYYNNLTVELFEAETTKSGKVKNPIKGINPADLLFKTDDNDQVKFYSGITTFQQNYNSDQSEAEIEALKAIVKNPEQIPFYLQDSKQSVAIQASTITAVDVHLLEVDLRLSVNQRDDYYEITGRLIIEGKSYELDNLVLVHQYFVKLNNQLYLIGRLDFLRVIGFFKKQSNRLILHKTKYPEFQKVILVPLEGSIHVDYSYLKPATKSQIEEKGFDLENEQLIYLSESEDYILLTPVMRYGNLEIPVLSKKQIQAQDKLGNLFTLHRDEKAELQFIGNVLKQHPYFYDQETNDSFYLHRKRFLEEAWFLEAFEVWRNKGIHILGFNQLKNNKLSAFQAKINIEVLSGTDWFETKVKVKFGKQQVALKHLHKSIRNKSKFVTLDDGTQGILPHEWIEKFAAYFNAGEVTEDAILTPKIKFASINELYEDALLDGDVKNELKLYKQKFEGTDSIQEVEVPKGLTATLRHYQKDGLNWLNFLDDFNFGSCLADDMGLGKTIQVLAFILSQREKVKHNTNLVVVPASLIFNWKAEVEKFAPSIKVKTIYAGERTKTTDTFDDYEIILTSYGTLLSDIRFLKDYRFNYIFLDESQLIKNPDSQRYKAVRMLQSRNKVTMTGTPIENNTFDLYGQLSFACPGLFGSKQQFADLYSTPIDQFKDSRRADELQQKIRPFILRRTKEQVAKELPDKTEIVLYCEMGAEQREVYEANKKEIQDFILGKQEDELPKSSMHVLKSITTLRQICNSAALLADGKSYLQASSKIDILMEQIESKAGKHKILVFSQFVTMLDLIKKQLENRGIKYEYLTGQTRKRAEVVSSFQQNADIPVFLISLKAGGTGLNLTEADYVYLVDPWWNPAVENQAIDRAYRIGQHKNVMAVRLICPDTIEEKIMKLQATKKDLVKDLIQTDGSLFKNLTKKELLGLLS